MNPWHHIPVAEILAEAQTWEGTPHRDRMAKRGVGIDCLYFLAAVACKFDVLPPFTMPFYRPIWGVGREFNVIERVLLGCCHATVVDKDGPLETGDAVIFSVGRQSNHVGLVIGAHLWHSIVDQGVVADDITDARPWQSVVRLHAPGFTRRPETLSVKDLAP